MYTVYTMYLDHYTLSRNPMAAVCNVADYAKSTKLLASTTLR